MEFHRRHLPHLYAISRPVFVTWRLHGSLPSNRHFDRASLTSGEAFVMMDRLLDEATLGPLYLRRPEIAGLVVEAIQFNGSELATIFCMRLSSCLIMCTC
jgi:hypothetical protein